MGRKKKAPELRAIDGGAGHLSKAEEEAMRVDFPSARVPIAKNPPRNLSKDAKKVYREITKQLCWLNQTNSLAIEKLCMNVASMRFNYEMLEKLKEDAMKKSNPVEEYRRLVDGKGYQKIQKEFRDSMSAIQSSVAGLGLTPSGRASLLASFADTAQMTQYIEKNKKEFFK